MWSRREITDRSNCVPHISAYTVVSAQWCSRPTNAIRRILIIIILRTLLQCKENAFEWVDNHNTHWNLSRYFKSVEFIFDGPPSNLSLLIFVPQSLTVSLNQSLCSSIMELNAFYLYFKGLLRSFKNLKDIGWLKVKGDCQHGVLKLFIGLNWVDNHEAS